MNAPENPRYDEEQNVSTVEYLIVRVPRPRSIDDAVPTERPDWQGQALRSMLAGLAAWCAGADVHTEPTVEVEPMPDATHDTPKRRRPRICGVMSASGPEREMLACAYKPGHEDAHSWATLPTFPLCAEVVIGEVGRLLLERYGSFDNFPMDARSTYSWLVDTLLGPGQHHLPSITKPVKLDA